MPALETEVSAQTTKKSKSFSFPWPKCVQPNLSDYHEKSGKASSPIVGENEDDDDGTMRVKSISTISHLIPLKQPVLNSEESIEKKSEQSDESDGAMESKKLKKTKRNVEAKTKNKQTRKNSVPLSESEDPDGSLSIMKEKKKTKRKSNSQRPSTLNGCLQEPSSDGGLKMSSTNQTERKISPSAMEKTRSRRSESYNRAQLHPTDMSLSESSQTPVKSSASSSTKTETTAPEKPLQKPQTLPIAKEHSPTEERPGNLSPAEQYVAARTAMFVASKNQRRYDKSVSVDAGRALLQSPKTPGTPVTSLSDPVLLRAAPSPSIHSPTVSGSNRPRVTSPTTPPQYFLLYRTFDQQMQDYYRRETEKIQKKNRFSYSYGSTYRPSLFDRISTGAIVIPQLFFDQSLQQTKTA